VPTILPSQMGSFEEPELHSRHFRNACGMLEKATLEHKFRREQCYGTGM